MNDVPALVRRYSLANNEFSEYVASLVKTRNQQKTKIQNLELSESKFKPSRRGSICNVGGRTSLFGSGGYTYQAKPSVFANMRQKAKENCKLYDDLIAEIKNENPHRKLTKFITSVEEQEKLRSQILEIHLKSKKKRD